MNYLTVQDLIWIHLQVAKKSMPFDFARLEDGVFDQYGYGKSQDLPKQASRFLYGLTAKQPFGTHNEAAAFVGFLAFCELNGFHCELPDSEGVAWVSQATKSDHGALSRIHRSEHHHHDPDLHEIVHEILAKYPKTIQGLTSLAAAS